MNIDEYIRFDDINKQFTIPSGTYSYSDVVRVSVLNEKAKGKGIPFTAILPSGPLPFGNQYIKDRKVAEKIKEVMKKKLNRF